MPSLQRAGPKLGGSTASHAEDPSGTITPESRCCGGEDWSGDLRPRAGFDMPEGVSEGHRCGTVRFERGAAETGPRYRREGSVTAVRLDGAARERESAEGSGLPDCGGEAGRTQEGTGGLPSHRSWREPQEMDMEDTAAPGEAEDPIATAAGRTAGGGGALRRRGHVHPREGVRGEEHGTREGDPHDRLRERFQLHLKVGVLEGAGGCVTGTATVGPVVLRDGDGSLLQRGTDQIAGRSAAGRPCRAAALCDRDQMPAE